MARKTNKTTEAEVITVEATTVDTTPEQPTAVIAADTDSTALTTAVELPNRLPESGQSQLAALPDPDAPAINASEPEVSFKIDFSDKTQWFASEDGGKTKEGTDSPRLTGSPIDLVLQLSKAGWGDGYDQRLRLAFQFDDGGIGELNINAVNSLKDGTLYVTSPARSLVGGLLAISESPDDMEAFCRMARFSIRPGRGKGVFVDVDIAACGRWVAMSSAGRTNQIAKDPAGFHAQLSLIKQRFRGAGLLLTGGAVVGDLAGYDTSMRLLSTAGDTTT